jgi:branched-chain amino acid aminotransferase
MMDHELRDAADAAIKEKSVFEVLLADRHGNITEGSRSNVFFIKDGELYTPPAAQILKGVTRLKVLEVAEKMGLKIHEEAISAEQALESDAAFISGTSPGVLPISSIEDRSFDVNDAVLRQIMNNYDQLLLQDQH